MVKQAALALINAKLNDFSPNHFAAAFQIALSADTNASSRTSSFSLFFGSKAFCLCNHEETH